MTRLVLKALLVVALLVLPLLPAHANEPVPGPPLPPEPTPAPIDGTGTPFQFKAHCDVHSSAPDDSVVKPGQTGAAHMHTFFGGTPINAFSTSESLRAGHTTCHMPQIESATATNGADRAGYWIAALYDQHGRQRVPSHVVAYYQRGAHDGTVEPFPAGLKIVTSNYAWRCVRPDNSKTAAQSTIPACASDQHLMLRLQFPQCWDGINLDTADHRSHMAFLSQGACPPSHPHKVVDLRISARWAGDIAHGISRYRGDLGAYLSSDAEAGTSRGRSAHGDFLEGWLREHLEFQVYHCVNRNAGCNASDSNV
jgi:hypothetical protein